MSATTELVRQVVQDVLEDEPDVKSDLARAIGSKIAGDPELDRVDIAEDTLEPVAYRVADATYRIDLDGFGVSDPDRARREIVEKVTHHFAAQTEDPEPGTEPDQNNNSTASDSSDIEQSKTADGSSDDGIIVAGSEANYEEEMEPTISGNNEDSANEVHVGAAAVNSTSDSDHNQSQPTERESDPEEDESDDIIVAEPDDFDMMDTAYDDEERDADENDDDSSGEPTIMW